MIVFSSQNSAKRGCHSDTTTSLRNIVNTHSSSGDSSDAIYRGSHL